VKKILAILIVVSLFLQCTVQLSVLAMFRMKQDYIAKHLCENRSRPQIKCCGKCYLNKQLHKVSDDSGPSKDNTVKIEKPETLVYILPVTKDVYISATEVGRRLFPLVVCMSGRLKVHSIFHPPQVA